MPDKLPRACWDPGCFRLNCTVHVKPMSYIRQPDPRPSAALRGYGALWRKRRAEFLDAHPTCEDCGQPSTVPDHIPSRRELVARGVKDPDADQYLHARCQSCHSARTNAEDGGGWHGQGVGGKNV